jgi:glucosylceramidase
MKQQRNYMWLISILMMFAFGSCSKSSSNNSAGGSGSGGGSGGGGGTPATNDMDMWLTKADQSVLLQKQTAILSFVSTATAGYGIINVDSATAYQSIDGFGYTLTGGSAYQINHMDAASRATLLNELFSTGSMGISYLRVSIGASDLSASVFSYDDMPAGMTDPTLANFNLSQDLTDLIPVLQQIIAINPNIKILGSPWSPPAWMKTNGNSVDGSLLPAYYGVYAKYFVKYIQAMQAKGIRIDAITIQNEPENKNNNPSMLMTAAEQTNFIKNNLGPEFQTAGVTTKIIIFDHNCDNPNYPITVLNDAAAKQYIDGSAFHLYLGNISALSAVKTAHPDRNIYFTEQWTAGSGNFSDDLKWHVKNVLIGSMRNWSKVALEWNLASDATYGPHTPGGCTDCKGALTVNGTLVQRNVGYYIIAHASKFVPAGSVRIESGLVTNLPNVAFKTPAGKKVLIVVNEGGSAEGFNIGYKGKYVFTSLNAGAVATFTW